MVTPQSGRGWYLAYLELDKCYQRTTMHCMENQLTLRVPADLARRLAARAKAGGVKRSQVVREALQMYLASAPKQARTTSVKERLAPYIGAVTLDAPSAERDELSQRLRSQSRRSSPGA